MTGWRVWTASLSSERATGPGSRGRSQRLVQVPQDILDILKADAQTNEIGRDAGADLVVLAQLAVRGGRGWIARLLASPTLARWLKSCRLSMNFLPAARRPSIPKPRIAPDAFWQVLFCRARDRDCDARPGKLHPASLGWFSRNSATRLGVRTWRSMRRLSVSMPCTSAQDD